MKNITLMSHQLDGVEIAKQRDRFAYFYDTRTGKTPMMLKVLEDKLQNTELRFLIVCPLVLATEAWLSDARDYFPEVFEATTFLYGKTKTERLKTFNTPHRVGIHNTEAFANYAEHIYNQHYDGVILDESSSLRSPSSIFSKSFLKFCWTVKYCYILSGTPASNGEHEYYIQLRCIDDTIFSKYVTHFYKEWFTNISWDPRFKKWELRKDREQEFKNLLKTCSVYVEKEDVMEVAGRSTEIIEVEWPTKDLKEYKKFKRERGLELESGEIVAVQTAGVLAGKLQQYASGFLYGELNKVTGVRDATIYFNEYKLSTFKQFLREVIKADQAIIWAFFREEFKQLSTWLTDSCRVVNGDTSYTQKIEALRLFKKGEIQFLLASPMSLDKGVTLTNAHICIFYGLIWSWEHYKQAEERIYGSIQSQPLPCKTYVLLSKGTIDERIYYDAILQKKNASSVTLDYLKGGE